MPQTSDPITNNLAGLILLILIIAVPLAFMASIGLLGLYRRAVIRAMRKRDNSGQIESEPPMISVQPKDVVQRALNIAVLDSAFSLTTNSAPEASIRAFFVARGVLPRFMQLRGYAMHL